MKIYSSILILTTFALHAYSHAILSNIKFSPESNQHILSDGVDKNVPGNNDFSYCNEDFKEDIVQLDFVDLSPKVPKKGEKFLIKASGKLREETKEGAFVRVKVAYGLITLINIQADLCEQISNVDLSCPLEKGTFKIEKEVKLPSEIPMGIYRVSADAYNVDDERLVCLTSQIKF